MNYLQVSPLMISQTMSGGKSYILVLECAEQDKQVPVLIGENEAQAVLMAVEQKSAKRPMTHTLLFNILKEYMLNVQKVTIDRFEEGIFFSTLHINDGFTDKQIDCRTSDGIVLAIMSQANIYINASVLQETFMEPNALFDNLPENKRPLTSPVESIEELEALLQECEDNEDYEQAQRIMDRINALKENNPQA